MKVNKIILLFFLITFFTSCSSKEKELSKYIDADFTEIIHGKEMRSSEHLMITLDLSEYDKYPNKDIFTRCDRYFKKKGFVHLPKRYKDLNRVEWKLCERSGISYYATLDAYWVNKEKNVLVNLFLISYSKSKSDLEKGKLKFGYGAVNMVYENKLKGYIERREVNRVINRIKFGNDSDSDSDSVDSKAKPRRTEKVTYSEGEIINSKDSKVVRRWVMEIKQPQKKDKKKDKE